MNSLLRVYHTAMRFVALLIVLLICLGGCEPAHSVRIATFNIAMGLEESGQLEQALASGNDPRLQQVAAILQEVRQPVIACGVLWPTRGEAGHQWVEVSDHRLVWLDISL